MINKIDKYFNEVDAIRISFDKIIPFLSDNMNKNREVFFTKQSEKKPAPKLLLEAFSF